MGWFDVLKEKKAVKKAAAIADEKKDDTEVGKKVAKTALTAVEKRNKALEDALKGI